jgi:hypothetical protein
MHRYMQHIQYYWDLRPFEISWPTGTKTRQRVIITDNDIFDSILSGQDGKKLEEMETGTFARHPAFSCKDNTPRCF